MNTKSFLNDMQEKISQILENSPAKDIEKNVKALLTQGLSRLDLVTREEFDAQALTLARIRDQLDALEKRVVSMETAEARPDSAATDL